MNNKELHEYIENSSGNESNIAQICVIRKGKIILNDSWRGFTDKDAANVNSVTKGIMGLLTGIAIDEGFIRSVDQKVLDFFPNYQVKRGEKTIYELNNRHLMTMTAPYKYRHEPWTKVCISDDWTLAALDLLGGRGGITGEFKYATLGIQVLAGIIENASGMKCIDFANRYLFSALALPERTDHGNSSKEDQFDYLMNKNPRRYEWYTDPKGTVTAGWGLCMSAQELAKIGNLILDDGIYKKKRIISKEYLKDMLRPHLKLDERMGNMSYGYLWYKPFENKEVYAAIGDGGNIIYVNREENTSVGITGTFKPRIFDRVGFIEKVILPSL